jgi:hypothetical protein
MTTLRWCHHCGKWGAHDTKGCPNEPVPTLFDQPPTPPKEK